MTAHADDPFDAAQALARQGRADEAMAALGTLLAATPDHARAWATLGALHLKAGRAPAALGCLDRALALDPSAIAAHVDRGSALAVLERRAEALAALDAAVALDPSLAHAHSNRAHLLNLLDRHAEALAAADAAVAGNRGLVHAWRHRGRALIGLDRAGAALESFRTALAAAGPAQRAEALSDVGFALAALGRDDEALAAFDEALALSPDAFLPRQRRAETRLRRGDFGGGWDDYEARWRRPYPEDRPIGLVTPELRRRLTLAPKRPDLEGRRVLALGEQGVGDEIMFLSVLPDLAAVAGHTACLVDRRLVRLVSGSMSGVEVLAGHDPTLADPARFDLVTPMGSLCGVFRRARADFPGRPYLAPSPDVAAAWRERLGPRRARLRVGISWRGGVAATRATARSMPLLALRPLLERDDCEFVSLQYGEVAAELAEANAVLPRPITSFPAAEIDDFEDLAALVGALDVVVTVQTALAHLTGAVGQRGLVMIPERPEWRYGASGETIPWYASLRLLRQTGGGGWGPVIERVGALLDGAP